MIKRVIWVGCCCLLCCMAVKAKQERQFPTLEALDRMLLCDTFDQKQIEYVDSLKRELRQAATPEEQYGLKDRLFSAYLVYELDSALAYAHAKLQIASRLKQPTWVDDARMNIANVYIIAGMYKEATDTLKAIRTDRLPEGMRSYYYSNCCLLYEGMRNYTIDPHLVDEYDRIAASYSDSVAAIQGHRAAWAEAERLMKRGEYKRAGEVLDGWYNSIHPDSREMAYAAYALADYYKRQGMKEEEKGYLIISAMADARWAVKEYVSLRRLATILYEEGDIGRAYAYMSRSLRDATFCNARLRTIEATQMLPIVDQAFRTKEEADKAYIRKSLVCISLLGGLLAALCVYAVIQLKRLARARKGLKEANSTLERLNGELTLSNGRLNESNDALEERNRLLQEADNIKRVYIGKFMTECMAYIDKFDRYRIALNKKAVTGKQDELYAMLRSDEAVKEAKEAFYITFDEAFLQIFPSFVEQFNQLLAEGEAVIPKKQGRLTTELRIFALVRLGITDSRQIASFFHYSTATIYSYRSRLRLRSKCPDKFEEEVMRISSE